MKYFALKMLFLSFALGITVYAMYVLNSRHTIDMINSLGFSGQHLNWCTDRLVRLESSGPESPWSLEEKDKKWLLQKTAQPELIVDYLAIEKWLAKHCSLEIYLYKKHDLLDKSLRPLAKATFSDGSTASIYLIDKDIYQINEVIFTSDEMRTALKELSQILKI